MLFNSQKIVNFGVLVTEAFYLSISKFETLYKSISLYIALVICNFLEEQSERNVFQRKIVQTPCNLIEKSVMRNPRCIKKRLNLTMRLCILARYFVCVHHKSVQIASFCG